MVVWKDTMPLAVAVDGAECHAEEKSESDVSQSVSLPGLYFCVTKSKVVTKWCLFPLICDSNCVK
jgi:hypothetical protein